MDRRFATDPQSPGTINADGIFGELANFYIVQQSGTISRNRAFNNQTLSGSSYVLEGGVLTGRVSFLENGASLTVNGGTYVVDLSRDLNVNGAIGSSSSFSITGGTSSIGRDLEVFNGAVFTISGGVLDVVRDIGNRNFHDIAEFNFNGGNTAAQYLTFGTASTMTFGGSNAGSVVVDNFGGDRHNTSNIRIDFLSGSLMSLELINAVESGNTLNSGGNPVGDLGWSTIGGETGLVWAEALWSDGRLTYNGQNFNDLGNWESVNGSIFSFNSDTLSLVPETSSFALLVGILALVRISFRRSERKTAKVLMRTNRE